MRFLVLGPIQVLQDGRTIPIPAGKQRALLAALLVDANRSVPVDTLIERLWGHRPPATASKNLQVLVSQLRKALGEAAVATEPGGYRLRVADTDSGEFDALLARGRGELAAGRPRDALPVLDEALALWRGRPYEDVVYEDFVRGEAARLEDRRLECQEERFDALLAEGRHRDALAGLERLAAEHPLDERLQAQLILALHRSGRRAETHAAYDRVRQRLSEELGIEPGERLRRLHAAILEAAGGEEPPPTSCGRHARNGPCPGPCSPPARCCSARRWRPRWSSPAAAAATTRWRALPATTSAWSTRRPARSRHNTRLARHRPALSATGGTCGC